MRPTFLVLLAIFSLCLADANEFVIDLDLPPLLRYDDILRTHSGALREAHDAVMKLVPASVKAFMELVYHTVTKIAFKEFADELHGISKILNLNEHDIFILNCIYELRSLCTSIVAKDAKGKILLARNLDFGFQQYLRRLHVNIIYRRGGKELFRCGGLAGFVGVLTCMRPNEYAVSLNLRKMYSEVNCFKAFMLGRPPLTWLIRNIMTNAHNYHEALSLFARSKSVAASYITIAGVLPDEGAILTRDREGAIDIQFLNSTNWFVSQCNNDHWNATDDRTRVVKEWMIKMGQDKVTLDRMKEDILFKPPLMQNMTIATILMSPIDNTMEVFVAKESQSPPPTYLWED